MSSVPASSALAPNGITYDGANDPLFAFDQSPTFSSPLIIQSPDKTQSAGIYCNNNGNMVVASDSDGSMYLGSGNGTVQFYSPNQSKTGSISVLNNGDMVLIQDLSGVCYLGRGNIQFASADQTQNAQLAVANNGDTGLYQAGSGSTLFLGGSSGSVSLQNLSTSPSIRVGASNGIVYDTVYTKPFTITTLQIVPTVGNITYDDTASFVAGLYQLQLTVETLTATGGASNFLEIACSAPPSTDVINFSSTMISPGAVGTTLCLNSGYFAHAGGNLRVLMNATSTPWTGSWSLQLVKLG